MRRLLSALVLAAALALAFASSASAYGAWGSNGCGTSEKRPSLIAFTCGDGSVVFETAGWSRWGGNEAVASGYLKHPDTEDPSCARRPISACPVVEAAATVRFSASAFCPSNSRWQFLNLHLEAPEDVDPELRTIDRRFKCGEYARFEPPPPRRYWQDCGYPTSLTQHTVIAHRVNCPKARRMIRRIGRVGFLPGKPNPFDLEGFECTVFPRGDRQILCQRGSRRIRGAFPALG